MGKIKKLRQKTKKINEKLEENEIENNKKIEFPNVKFNFSKLNNLLNVEDSVPVLVDPNEKSKIKTKLKNNNFKLKKKDKLREKRKNLIKKVDNLIQLFDKKERKEKIKNKKQVFNDLTGLKDALPSLDDLFQLKPKPELIKTGLPSFSMKLKENQKNHITNKVNGEKKIDKKTKKEMKRQRIKKLAKEYKQRFNHIQQTMKHDEFKRNPREAIAMHIKLTMSNST